MIKVSYYGLFNHLFQNSCHYLIFNIEHFASMVTEGWNHRSDDVLYPHTDFKCSLFCFFKSPRSSQSSEAAETSFVYLIARWIIRIDVRLWKWLNTSGVDGKFYILKIKLRKSDGVLIFLFCLLLNDVLLLNICDLLHCCIDNLIYSA